MQEIHTHVEKIVFYFLSASKIHVYVTCKKSYI
jgi:hypothetical protein